MSEGGRTARALTGLLVASAATCIAAEYAGLRAVVYVAKPLATLATIAIAVTGAPPVSPRYRALVAAGLGASLAGDVYLMLPGDLFLAGLGSFLVAHLLYVAAFAGAGGGFRDPGAASGVAVFAGAMLALLWPSLGAMRWPVVAYVAVIATMAWQAAARWRHVRTAGAGLAALGAASFLVSDSVLAIRRFRGDFGAGAAIVLLTYWFAQWGIARSVARDG